MGRESRRSEQRRREAQRPRIDLKLDELPGLLERTKEVLSPEDHATLKALTETLTFVARELLARTTTLERLRHLLFESKTEKTSSVLGDAADRARHRASAGPCARRFSSPRAPRARGARRPQGAPTQVGFRFPRGKRQEEL